MLSCAASPVLFSDLIQLFVFLKSESLRVDFYLGFI